MAWTDNQIVAAIGLAALALIISVMLGLIFMPGRWYACLNKSRFMPPGWVFAMVWFILYPLLGVSAVAACYGEPSWTWIIPVANIVASFLFTPAFFGLHSTSLGFFITLFCLMLGILVIVQYATVNHSTLAACLMIPYVLWLCLATYLAFTTLISNDQQTLAYCERYQYSSSTQKKR